jgi:ABC-type Mn2+/Zn2+ transport system permease subunit
VTDPDLAWATFLRVGDSYLATLLMAGVCSYLGVYCVLRRIVFTGVALAQLAAAGVAGAFFVAGQWPGTVLGEAAARSGPTVGSLGASVLGALGLSPRHHTNERLTADTLVGLVYAAAAALAVLLVWRSPHGLAELRNILAGEVLLSRNEERRILWLGLLAVAAVHVYWRREFLLVSFDPEFARSLGLPERRYQVAFLVSLAVAVALSLKAGGLLMVFGFLVLPAAVGLNLVDGLRPAVILALAAAFAASGLGFAAAILFELPVAPSVAGAGAALVGLAALGRAHPLLGKVVWGAILFLAGLALLLAPVVLLVSPEAPASHPILEPNEHLADRHDGSVSAAHGDDVEHTAEELVNASLRDLREGQTIEDRAAAARRLAELRGGPLVDEALVEAMADLDAPVREAAAAALRARPGSAETVSRLRGADDLELAACALLAQARTGHPDALPALVDLLEREEAPFPTLEQALELLRAQRGGEGFGYELFGDAAVNAEALAQWRTWLAERGG